MKKREPIGAMRNGKVYFFNVLTTKTIDMVTWGQMYKSGYREPRFPVPAIPTRIGYHPSGVNEMEGVPYIYVSTDTYLQTFWKDYGLFEEWSS